MIHVNTHKGQVPPPHLAFIAMFFYDFLSLHLAPLSLCVTLHYELSSSHSLLLYMLRRRASNISIQ